MHPLVACWLTSYPFTQSFTTSVLSFGVWGSTTYRTSLVIHLYQSRSFWNLVVRVRVSNIVDRVRFRVRVGVRVSNIVDRVRVRVRVRNIVDRVRVRNVAVRGSVRVRVRVRNIHVNPQSRQQCGQLWRL